MEQIKCGMSDILRRYRYLTRIHCPCMECDCLDKTTDYDSPEYVCFKCPKMKQCTHCECIDWSLDGPHCICYPNALDYMDEKDLKNRPEYNVDNMTDEEILAVLSAEDGDLAYLAMTEDLIGPAIGGNKEAEAKWDHLYDIEERAKEIRKQNGAQV